MKVWLAFWKGNRPSQHETGACCHVQAHEPKGGDLIDFDWKQIDADSLLDAQKEYVPLWDGKKHVARKKLIEGNIENSNDKDIEAALIYMDDKELLEEDRKQGIQQQITKIRDAKEAGDLRR